MKKIYYLLFLVGIILISESAWAQDSGSQDSTGLASPALRPRRDTYIIVPYPSPAMHGVTMNIQVYNHNPQQLSVRIEDVTGKLIQELQPPEMKDRGIHSYPFQTSRVSAGTYHIRLITYTSGGAQDMIQDSQFIVVH